MSGEPEGPTSLRTGLRSIVAFRNYPKVCPTTSLFSCRVLAQSSEGEFMSQQSCFPIPGTVAISRALNTDVLEQLVCSVYVGNLASPQH